MEARAKVNLLSLEPYRHLFPVAQVSDQTVKKGASVSDTVDFIPQIVEKTSWQVGKFVDQELRGLPKEEACEKLWNFVKQHIRYEKDERGKEQVRSPRRLINDVKGDCDCFTTFIDTCLYVLQIPVINRITKYKEDYFQHIYPIVPLGKGGYITMDCVVDSYNYEEPFTEKKDYPMDLQFLDGIENSISARRGVDAQDLFSNQNDIGELGKLLKRGSGEQKQGILKKPLFQKKTPEQKQAKKEDRQSNKKKTLSVVNKVNKVNPATILLRAGILASMKLNVMKVAEKIKWGYVSRDFAKSKGMDMSKYDKVKNILKKTEQIFFAAGGKPENLRKAILTGHGNRNHEVAGLDGSNENTPLKELLGEVYRDEFLHGMEGFGGFGELGEPVTATSVAAASTAMGSLAALLKSLGDLFPKKSMEPKTKNENPAKKEKSSGNSESDSGNSSGENSDNVSEQDTEESQEQTSENADENSGEENSENLPATTDEETGVSTTETDSEENPGSPEESTDGVLAGIPISIKAFYEKNKKWIIPVGITAGVLTTALIINHFAGNSDKPKSKKKQKALNGFPKKRSKAKKKPKGARTKQQKSLIALM